MRRLGFLLLVLSQACTCEAPLAPGEVLGDGFISARAVTSSSVEVKFSRNIDKGSVSKGAFSISDYTVVPPVDIEVKKAEAKSDVLVALGTGGLVPGTRYTLTVKGLKDAQGRPLDGTLNFVATGAGAVVSVEIEIADVETARLHTALSALATVNDDGSFSEDLQAYPVIDEGSRFVARMDVQIDAARTLDSGDDTDVTIDRRPYAVLLMDDAGRMASALVRFVLPDEGSVRTVPVAVLPPIEIVDPPDTDVLPDPPEDPNPADGVCRSSRWPSAPTAPSTRASPAPSTSCR
jgi:hypothetical protein